MYSAHLSELIQRVEANNSQRNRECKKIKNQLLKKLKKIQKFRSSEHEASFSQFTTMNKQTQNHLNTFIQSQNGLEKLIRPGKLYFSTKDVPTQEVYTFRPPFGQTRMVRRAVKPLLESLGIYDSGSISSPSVRGAMQFNTVVKTIRASPDRITFLIRIQLSPWLNQNKEFATISLTRVTHSKLNRVCQWYALSMNGESLFLFGLGITTPLDFTPISFRHCPQKPKASTIELREFLWGKAEVGKAMQRYVKPKKKKTPKPLPISRVQTTLISGDIADNELSSSTTFADRGSLSPLSCNSPIRVSPVASKYTETILSGKRKGFGLQAMCVQENGTQKKKKLSSPSSSE